MKCHVNDCPNPIKYRTELEPFMSGFVQRFLYCCEDHKGAINWMGKKAIMREIEIKPGYFVAEIVFVKEDK